MTWIVDALGLANIDPADIAAGGAGGWLAYTKALPSSDWLAASARLGLLGAFIHEDGETWAYGGHPAGVAAATASRAAVAALGSPYSSAAIYYTAKDGTPDIGSNGPLITACFAGILEADPAPCGAYGSRAALDAARAAGPGVAYLWGVETWGQPNWLGYPLTLMQIANGPPSPIPNTDRDNVLLEEWGQAPTSSPPPPLPGDLPMLYVLRCAGSPDAVSDDGVVFEVSDVAGDVPIFGVSPEQRAYIIPQIRAERAAYLAALSGVDPTPAGP